MTPAQEVETSIAQNSAIRDYLHPEDHIVTSTNIDNSNSPGSDLSIT